MRLSHEGEIRMTRVKHLMDFRKIQVKGERLGSIFAKFFVCYLHHNPGQANVSALLAKPPFHSKCFFPLVLFNLEAIVF